MRAQALAEEGFDSGMTGGSALSTAPVAPDEPPEFPTEPPESTEPPTLELPAQRHPAASRGRRRAGVTDREPTTDSVADYLRNVAGIPLLDAATEVELCQRIEAGLYATHLLERGEFHGGRTREELEWVASDGHAAWQQMVESNLRLVVSIARRYSRSPLPFPDLVQEGNLGLMRAITKFDYTKGYKFSTYATWWIRQSMRRGISNQARTIRVPTDVAEMINTCSRTRSDLAETLGRDPTHEEVAAELDITADRAAQLATYEAAPVSLSLSVNPDDDTELGDLLPHADVDVVADVMHILCRRHLLRLLDELEPREASILRHRFGLVDGTRHTWKDLGERYGVSSERVRQIADAALQRLRDAEYVDQLRDYLLA